MDGKAICERFDSLKVLRSNYERDWSDIADVLRPIGKGFSSYQQEGQRKHTRIYDASPLQAVEHFKAGLYSSMTPQGSMWFELQHVDAKLNEFGPVKEYLEIVNDRTWKSFGPGVSAFYNQITAVYADLGAFGTGVLYSAELFGKQRFIDRARALHECYIDVDESDIVDTLFRRYELTSRAIATRAAEYMDPEDRWNVPQKILTEAEKSPSSKHFVIHAVYPDNKPSANYGKRWKECYVLEEEKHVLKENGYFEFPYMAPRWDVAAGERYGRGCGHVALADVKSLNVARKSNLGMMDRAARPVILAHKENDVGGGIAPYPGEVLYGAISGDGKKLVAPMDEGKNPAIALEMERQLRSIVKDAFYFGLMETVSEREMTLGEYMGRNEERQRLLGPYLGRVETELLSPLVHRRVGMLERAGQLPEMPEELAAYPGGLQVRYVSPLSRLQRRSEADAANAAMAAIGQAAAVMPELITEIDPRMLAEVISDGYGAKILRSREASQQIKDMQEQQQAAMAAAAAAPGMAKSVRDMADASQKVVDIRARQGANAA